MFFLAPQKYFARLLSRNKRRTSSMALSSRTQTKNDARTRSRVAKKNSRVRTNARATASDAGHVVALAKEVRDTDKRLFLKVLGGAGVGLLAATVLPKKADALVMGSTPASSVVGVKDASNVRVSPATEATLAAVRTGLSVSKLTLSLSASGNVHTPASGKKIRVYASRFSLTADATSVSFRFTAGGTDHERYVSPKTGGLYGANNHPNYIEGGVDQVLYCVISGTTNVQINIDYLEV